MAIDGRQIARPPEEKDAYDSVGLRVAAALVVVVPIVALTVLAYFIGTWTGGVLGGVLSVASTLLTVAVLWVIRRRRRR
jgi:uncharacterized membrane protein YkgB